MSVKRENYQGEELAIRMEKLGGAVLRVCEALPRTRSGRHVEDQLGRCGTAVGAHYSEAQGAHSRKEFAYRVSLALREAREARHWLGVTHHAGYASGEPVEELQQEATAIVAILQAIHQKVRHPTTD